MCHPCPDLQQLESGQGGVILLWSIDTVAKYNDCEAKHGAIVKAIRWGHSLYLHKIV